MEIVNWQETQLQSLMAATTETDFFNNLAKVGRELGFEYCAYGMHMPLPLSDRKMFLLNNYSTDWQERYVTQNYLAVDPTVSHGLKSVLPLVWSETASQASRPFWEGAHGLMLPLVWSETVSEASRPFWEDAHAHGLKVGWAQASYDAKGVAGMLTLVRSSEPLTRAELSRNFFKISWLVQVAHEGMTRLLAAKRGPEDSISLTSREAEVLRWTADGKTSSEVGEIMNISERTVNFHVNNSLEKLGAANKTAAVIKAALLRLL